MKGNAPQIDLQPKHWLIIRDILLDHIPDREVIAFGSRAKWTARTYSDLDLAILGDEPLSLGASARLKESLVESDLPFKVDLVDWARVSDQFRSVILRDGVSLSQPSASSTTHE